jgi:GxxExxY protein
MDDWDLTVAGDQLIDAVLDCATEVHRRLGPGLLESVYELAMMVELREAGIAACRQVEVPVEYRGLDLGIGFRADIIVEGCLLLELKTVDAINAVHMAQTITYLKLLRIKRGFILNFNVRLMKDGIKRVSI